MLFIYILKWLMSMKIKNYIFLYIYIKMVYNYYQKNKQKFQKEAHERYQNLSEEEK